MTLELTLQKGLVGHWTMDDSDTSGGTLYDRSASDAHATLNNNPTKSATGIIGDAYSFDGTDDYLTVPPDRFGIGDFTFSCWLYPLANPATYSNNRIYLVDFRGDGTQNNSDMAFFMDSSSDDGQAQVRIFDGQIRTNYTINWTIGEWLHFAVTRDNGSYKLYIDGTEETNFSGNSNTNISNPYRFLRYSTGSGYAFDGRSTDLRLYDRTLSQSEISALYNMRSQRNANL